MCISPIRIRHPTRGFVDVPCGKCLECAQKKVNDWSFRMLNEMRDKNAYFFTLTYNDDNLPYKVVNDLYDDRYIPCFEKSDLQKLFQALRDDLRRKKLKTRLKYFVSSEYGGTTLRPHYHGIVFGYPMSLSDFQENLQKYWSKGFVSCSLCNERRVYYTLKYVFKNAVVKPKGLDPNSDKCFIMCSKNLGANFMTSQMVGYLKQNLEINVHSNGVLKTIPKYYRDRIFSAEEKDLIKSKFWDNFDPFEKCPGSQNPFEWRDQIYLAKIEKVKKGINKEKM